MKRNLLIVLLWLVLSSGCAIVARDHYYTMSADNAATRREMSSSTVPIGHNDGNILRLLDPDIDVEVESMNEASTVATIGPLLAGIPLAVIPVFPITILLPPYLDEKAIIVVVSIKELENRPVTLDPSSFTLSPVGEDKKYFPIKVDMSQRAVQGTPTVHLYSRAIHVSLIYDLGKDKGKEFIFHLDGVKVNGAVKTFAPIKFRQVYGWSFAYGP